uniref:Ig-like domain-containing protein n=1 Tax=Accipiter nisus TaxID=211598 RepID=A0A8B9M1U0_9AVES
LCYTFLFLLCFAASPSIKLLVDDPIVVNPGEAITLVCVTTGGEPAPSLTWVRSAGILPEKTVLNGGTLTIPAITSEDAGTYSCIANNNVGNPAKKSTNIIVRGGCLEIMVREPTHEDNPNHCFMGIDRECKRVCRIHKSLFHYLLDLYEAQIRCSQEVSI